MKFQERYLLYCRLIGKAPLTFPNYWYQIFISQISTVYKNEKKINKIHDQNDFNNYIIENDAKYQEILKACEILEERLNNGRYSKTKSTL